MTGSVPAGEESLQEVVGKLLRGGVLLAAAVVMAGGVLYLARHGQEVEPFHIFHGEPAELRSVGGIVGAAAAGGARAIIQLGLLILIATPVARVALAMALFAFNRDRTYTAVSATVLTLLLASLAGG
jgi:uncharacterized membrane protein